MCDQTEVSYLEDDVVWVKIGPIWWPGVVKDLEKDEEGKEILAGLKKKPIAVVKFFQEDNYEFVKNLDHIYHYNCRRKDEFIKKGLDKFRSGAVHMKKFPADVTTAESLVQGDVNIVNDPKFFPEKKQNYSEIFGSGKKTKKKESDAHPKHKVQSSNCSTPYRPITHQRFINKVLHGESDHKVRTLIQPAASPEDAISRGLYRCHVCKFETSRVNVIVDHHRLTHSRRNSINWTGSEVSSVKRKPVYKSRKSKAKRLFESLKADSSDSETPDKTKSKPSIDKSKSPVKSKASTAVTDRNPSVTPCKRRASEDGAEDNQKRPRFTDVLLADWGEDEEEDKKDAAEPGMDEECSEEREDEKEKEEGSSSRGSADSSGKDDDDDDADSATTKTDADKDEEGKEEEDAKNQNEKMSCFDFDEEEEGFIGMSNANTYGRKIPRVIPVKDKSELDVDMEIGELFKRKNEADGEGIKEEGSTISTVSDDNLTENEAETHDKPAEPEKTEEKTAGEEKEKDKEKDKDKEAKTSKTVSRKRKHSKDEDPKVNEDSLAVRRARRPGSKKSYLNEVIERIEDNSDEGIEKEDVEEKRVSSEGAVDEEKGEDAKTSPDVHRVASEKAEKEEVPVTSSRRKQDLKQQTMESNFEETGYAEAVADDVICSNDSSDKKDSSRDDDSNSVANDELTQRVDHLLAETNVPSLPEIPEVPESKADASKESESETPSNVVNCSFECDSPAVDDGPGKEKTEEKSSAKNPPFSDADQTTESNQQTKDHVGDDDSSGANDAPPPEGGDADSSEAKAEPPAVAEDDSKPATPTDSEGCKKQTAAVVSVALPSRESSASASPPPSVVVASEGSAAVSSGSKKVSEGTGEAREVQGSSASDSSEGVPKTKSVKTIKLKADALPPSLLSSAAKLKGQTIIHQKGGTYVILSQPPQLPRQKVAAAKGQTSGKLVILTNQLGEQKIITTSGLQQSKFKLDPNKVIVGTSTCNAGSDSVASTSGILSVGKAQPVIKMVPDGKGGIVKQLTVSPKKVLVGGTKVIVSGSGTTFASQGNTLQKIAFTGGNNLTGDYCLIENYKGSGKRVLIQGSANASAGVLLKANSGTQRHVGIGETVQGSPNILNVKKKPKILMRAATNQNEFVVHSDLSAADSPTYVMKRQGADGKFSTQKIIRRPVISPPKAKAAAGSKTFFLSEPTVQKGESLIIKTNHEPSGNKIIRLAQKVKESDLKQKFAQKIIQKTPETFAVAQGNIFAGSEAEEQEAGAETTQVVVQGQPQQPVLQTQVVAMPGPIGSDGNQTYVLVSVDEHGVVQPVDNSIIAYDAAGQAEPVFVNSNPNNNVILIDQQASEEAKPAFSNGSQDILAEALANTNVLDGNMSNEMESVVPSILLPPAIPSSVVQETSITLQKPIMTPLEMPTSVAPDTSGLEPPPLPPTPTEEDVLMEEQDAELPASDAATAAEELASADDRAKEESDDARERLAERCGEQARKEAKRRASTEGTEGIDGGEDPQKRDDDVPGFYDRGSKGGEQSYYRDREAPREEFIIENSQEEQGSSSFQSMPLLNDEPDTSDDALGSEPIADQDFELQKSRVENEDLSSLLREPQEPPSSTNNEVAGESGFEKQKFASVARNEPFHHPACQETGTDGGTRADDCDKSQEESKFKEMTESKELQSMPVITDEGSVNNSFDVLYSVDGLSHKKCHEETEVTSTTDEFVDKDANLA